MFGFIFLMSSAEETFQWNNLNPLQLFIPSPENNTQENQVKDHSTSENKEISLVKWGILGTIERI